MARQLVVVWLALKVQACSATLLPLRGSRSAINMVVLKSQENELLQVKKPVMTQYTNMAIGQKQSLRGAVTLARSFIYYDKPLMQLI